MGRTGRALASAAPYSDPPVTDGAGVPPAYAAAAGARPTAIAAIATEIPASTRFRPMPRTVDPHRQPVNWTRANAQVQRRELAARAARARRHPKTAVQRSSIRAITSRAPAFSSGSFKFPHFGDCTHDGQP